MITIFSSWGEITTDDFGNVIEKQLYEEEPCYLSNVVKFDIAEFDSWYEKKLNQPSPKPSTFDVLEVGFWKNDGAYIPADKKWREDMYTSKDQMIKDIIRHELEFLVSNPEYIEDVTDWIANGSLFNLNNEQLKEMWNTKTQD